MKSAELLIENLSYHSETDHLFAPCRMIKRDYEAKILGVYGQRLDGCDSKIRYAAKSLLESLKVIQSLEFGEFIYFDDQSKFECSYFLESFFIYSRAALDLGISAYYTYYTGKTNLDSIHDFLDKLCQVAWVKWIPDDRASLSFWMNLRTDYIDKENYNWIHSLVGRDKGLSLRDLFVHKQNVSINPFIDDDDKGRFYLSLGAKREAPPREWLELVFDSVMGILFRVRDDITLSEQKAL